MSEAGAKQPGPAAGGRARTGSWAGALRKASELAAALGGTGADPWRPSATSWPAQPTSCSGPRRPASSFTRADFTRRERGGARRPATPGATPVRSSCRHRGPGRLYIDPAVGAVSGVVPSTTSTTQFGRAAHLRERPPHEAAAGGGRWWRGRPEVGREVPGLAEKARRGRCPAQTRWRGRVRSRSGNAAKLDKAERSGWGGPDPRAGGRRSENGEPRPFR